MFFSKNRLFLISVAVVLAIDGGAADGTGDSSTGTEETATPKTIARQFIDETIAKHKIVIFSKNYCPFCAYPKQCFDALKEEYTTINLSDRNDKDTVIDVLGEMTGLRGVPKVFVWGTYIGDGSGTKKLFDDKKLKAIVDAPKPNN